MYIYKGSKLTISRPTTSRTDGNPSHRRHEHRYRAAWPYGRNVRVHTCASYHALATSSPHTPQRARSMPVVRGAKKGARGPTHGLHTPTLALLQPTAAYRQTGRYAWMPQTCPACPAQPPRARPSASASSPTSRMMVPGAAATWRARSAVSMGHGMGLVCRERLRRASTPAVRATRSTRQLLASLRRGDDGTTQRSRARARAATCRRLLGTGIARTSQATVKVPLV